MERELSAEFTYRSRFSPGYGDWPLTDQEKIFRLLELPKKIGLYVDGRRLNGAY